MEPNYVTALAIWEWVEKLISSFWLGLNWPHAVLIIFIVAVVYFKLEMKALIERILEFGPGGIKLQPPALQSARVDIAVVASAEVVTPLASPAVAIIAEIPTRPIIVFPQELQKNNQSLMLDISGLGDADAKNYLLNSLAFARCMLEFESCYSLIFGGQIRILQILNQRIGQVLSVQDGNMYWATHQAQHKPVLDLWSADQYLYYLTVRGLVIKEPNLIRLSTKGAEFVLWLTHFGRPLDKPW